MANYFGGGFDYQAYMMRKFMDKLLGEKDSTKEEREELSLEVLEKSVQISDADALTSMLNTATNQAEFDNLNKMLNNWDKTNRIANYDPVVQSIIQANILEAGEKSELYDNYKTAMDEWVSDYEGKYRDLDVDDIVKWSWEDMSDAVNDVSRLKHIIDLGAERGFTYKSGSARYDSKIVAKRAKAAEGVLDSAVSYLVNIPAESKDIKMPFEVARFISVGDTPGLKGWMTTETSKWKGYFDKSTSNYRALELRWKEASSKRTADDTVEILPEQLLNDLRKEGGEEAVMAYIQSLKPSAEIYDSFENALSNKKTGVFMDYPRYSKLLEMGMEFQQQGAVEASERFKQLTGKIPRKFETFDYDAAADLLKNLVEPELGPYLPEEKVKVDTTEVPYAPSKLVYSPLHKPKIKKPKEKETVLSSEEQAFKVSSDNFELLKDNYSEVSNKLFDAKKSLRKMNQLIKLGYDYDEDDYKNRKDKVELFNTQKEDLFKELEKNLKEKQSSRRNISAKSGEEFYRKKATEYLTRKKLPRTAENWEKAMKYVKSQWSQDWVNKLSEPVISGAENIAQYLRRIFK